MKFLDQPMRLCSFGEKVNRKYGCFFMKEGMTTVYKSGIPLPVTILRLIKQTILNRNNLSSETENNNPDTRSLMLVEDDRLVTCGSLKNPQAAIWHQAGLEEPKKGFIFILPERVQTENDVAQQIDILNESSLMSFLRSGAYVDICGISKGKGFAGVMKRWNFKGGRASHGNSLSHRSGGSTGMRQDPGRTMKNKKMAGHLGHEKVTQQNLQVVDIMKANMEDVLVLIKGSVPGPNRGLVFVSKAVKKNVV